ncbi:hypothetical protein J6590_096334 [Homalodisca vitripennis]|nr:hypothetical protein J6590_096334 [Homalodisca vitripennis]
MSEFEHVPARLYRSKYNTQDCNYLVNESGFTFRTTAGITKTGLITYYRILLLRLSLPRDGESVCQWSIAEATLDPSTRKATARFEGPPAPAAVGWVAVLSIRLASITLPSILHLLDSSPGQSLRA